MSRFTAYCTLFLLFVGLSECSKIPSKEAGKGAGKEAGNGCERSEKPYKKDTCISAIFIDDDYSEAEKKCYDEDGVLVTIDSAEKQKFVEDYLKSEDLEGNAWIGLKYSKDEKNYVWPYDRIVDYANWEEGHPTNDSNNCVQLKTESGKWSERPCEEDNDIVLCERLLDWSIEEIQAKLIYLTYDKVQLQTTIKDLALKNNLLESKLKNLMNTIIPALSSFNMDIKNTDHMINL